MAIDVLFGEKEDIIKTTLHELLHVLGYNIENTDTLQEFYKKKYKMPRIQNVNEGYIDFLAVILNSFLLSKILNDPYAFDLSLRCECGYIHQLAKQIISLDKKNIDRETNVFSYYIIKAELMDSLEDIHDIFNKEHCVEVLLQNNNVFEPVSPHQLSLKMNVMDVDLFKHKLA